MDNLLDVGSCLRALQSNKVTERKKAATKLEELLSADTVIDTIEKNSQNDRGIHWTIVFNAVKSYVDLEIEGLRNAKESQSATTLATRGKKKQEALSLYKVVIRKSSEKKPYLQVEDLLESILEWLQDDFTLKAFVSSLTSLLLKDVLRCRQYWLDITAEQWRRLLLIHCQLYINNEFDRNLLARAIQELMIGNTRQGNLQPQKMLLFFEKALDIIKSDHQGIYHMLCALNVFQWSIASNCRLQLCKFGEDNMNSLLSLWSRPGNDKFKEELVDILHLQMLVHHPSGVKTEQDGAMAYNHDLWKRLLRSLLDSITSDIENAARRTLFQERSRGLNFLFPSYINLASDVFQQVPDCIVGERDLPNADVNDEDVDTEEHGMPAKRPRLSNGNKTLLDSIQEHCNEIQAIPWLQILASVLTKYPTDFTKERLLEILKRISGILKASTRSQLFEPIFKVLSALARALGSYKVEPGEVMDVWQSIWTTCLNISISRQAQSEGYQSHGFLFMASVLDSKLIRPGMDTWNVFLLNFCKPTQASCTLLSSVITCKGLDERYCPNMLGRRQGAPEDNPFPLRQSLLEWLLSESCFNEFHSPNLKSTPPEIVSLLCLSIMHQDPGAILRESDAKSLLCGSNISSDACITNAPAASRKIGSRIFLSLSTPLSLQGPDLELLYLSSTFDKDRILDKRHTVAQVSICSKNKRLCNPLVSTIVRLITTMLKKEASSSSELLNAEVPVIQHLIWFGSFVSRLWNSLDFNAEGCSELRAILKMFVEKLGFLFVSHIDSNGTGGIQPIVRNLVTMINVGMDLNGNGSWVSDFMKSCLTSNFVDTVLSVASGRRSHPPTQESGSRRRNRYGSRMPSAASSGHLLSQRDSMDDFGEGPSQSRSRSEDFSDMETDDFDGGDGGHSHFGDVSQASSSSTFRDYDASDFLSPVSIKETDQIRVLSVKWLCLILTNTTTTNHQPQESGHRKLDKDSIRRQLLQLISNESFQPSKPVDVIILLMIADQLLQSRQEINAVDVKEILIALRYTAREHIRDQEIYCRLLFHLQKAIPCLVCEENENEDEVIVSCRKIVIKLIKNFGMVFCNSTERVKIEYIQVLLALLKHDPDSEWGIIGLGNDDDSTDSDSSDCTVSQLVLSHIKDSNASVRMLVAGKLKWLVQKWNINGRYEYLGKGDQLKLVKDITKAFDDVLDKQRCKNEVHLQDETESRRAVCLEGVATLATSSPVCEKECLLWLCRSVAEKNISPPIVIKMLKTVCSRLEFPDVKCYLERHLPFLLYNWFQRLNKILQKFPFKLMGYSSLTEFIRSHQNVVVSSLFVSTGSMDTIKNFMDAIRMDIHQAILSSLPHNLTYILPIHVRQSTGSSSAVASQSSGCLSNSQVNDVYDLLKSQLSQEEINDCVNSRLCEVTTLVICCLRTDLENNKLLIPDANPPSYTESEVVDTLDYIAKTFPGPHHATGQPSNTLISILAKIPCGLHTVLTSLYKAVCNEHRGHELLRLAQIYQLFVKMIMNELHTGLNDGWASVLREIMCRLLIMLTTRLPCGPSSQSKGEDSQCVSEKRIGQEIVLTYLDTLGLVSLVSIEICPDEMVNYLHRVMDVIASLESKKGAISRMAVNLLGKIMERAGEQLEHLEEVLALLNPLPDIPVWNDLKDIVARFSKANSETLDKKLSSFIESCELMKGSPSQGLVLRLQSLTRHALLHCSELKSLQASPQGCEQLKRAMSQLVSLTASTCPKVSLAATKLLGAIGPVGLGSLSLPTMHSQSSSYRQAMTMYREHEFEKYCWLLHFLDMCLLDSSCEVVLVAGDILKSVLAMPPLVEFKDSYQRRMNNSSFLFNYIHPFLKSGTQPNCMAPPSAPASVQNDIVKMIDQTDLWSPVDGSMSHGAWITNLMRSILSSGVIRNEPLSYIQPMCMLKVEMNEQALPYVVHAILGLDETGMWRDCLSKHFRNFFRAHCLAVGKHTSDSSPVYLKKDSLRVMINVVQHLRKQSKKPSRGRQPTLTPFDNNFWLDLDYLDVARAAHFCQANFSALLFIEICWDVSRSKETTSASSDLSNGNNSQGSSVDLSSQPPLRPGHSDRDDVQSLLLDIYSGVRDPDALYGCGAGRKADAHSRVLTYQQELDPAKALTTLDIEASHRKLSSPLQLLQTIQACGADNILQKCFEGFCQESKDTTNVELEEFRYETAWKLGQWDYGLPASYDETSCVPFHQAVYNALYSLRENHLDVATCVIEAARKSCLFQFDPKSETCQGFYPFLSQLQSLNLLQEVVDSLQIGHQAWKEAIDGVVDGAADDSLSVFRGGHSECVLAQLELIASFSRVLAKPAEEEEWMALRTKALWGLAVCARQAKHFQLAEKTMCTLKMEVPEFEARRGLPEVTIEQVVLEEAKLFWERSEVKIALDVTRNLINDMQRTQGQGCWPLLPKALATHGMWLAETKSEHPSVIMSDYLEKSVALLEDPSNSDTPQAVECFLALAQYADDKYQHMSEYLKSPDYKEKMALLKEVKELLGVAGDLSKSSKYLKTMEKNADIDEAEIEAFNRDHPLILRQALLNYLRVLKHGNNNDLKMFRVVALWLENDEDDGVNEMIQGASKDVPSYKFLPLYYQLAARMNVDGGLSDFQNVLLQLMERVAREHPHHTLWTVMALAHANMDNEMLSRPDKGRRATRVNSSQGQVTEEGRVQAAKQILDKLRDGRHKALGELIDSMEKLSVAYIELANWNVSQYKKETKPLPIDAKLQITKTKSVKGVLLPTVDLKVDPTGNYPDIVHPLSFDANFRLVGGVNLPKVIKCTGSDGKIRTQLVKGRDDLRQDAVMQQVFSLVNNVLAADPETRRRNLNIRTYKVVPLSQKSGLLEWCEGTQPIGEYLIGRMDGGAHARYRPKDWKPIDCRARLQNASQDRRFKAYQEICANFKPVLRHFFMEKFTDPPQWFERRLAYTRSVATNSIVGYVMGLGDRHVQNILIDINTAELVHIDLGIVFEMGLILPTPETVPFRLTRDIVDGMGISGVEGIFRRCCEKTMQVLRQNAEPLLTIVQVLMHDPLSHWTLSVNQVVAIQKKRAQLGLDSCEQSIASSGSVLSSSGQVRASGLPETSQKLDSKDDKNKIAERTLMRLKEKLRGVDDGTQLGVDGQVNSLIQRASDPKNLSRLYAGWQPYL